MRIAKVYSHLNGLEFLEARQPGLWSEIQTVIGDVDAEACRLKTSKEKRKLGRTLFSPRALNKAISEGFAAQTRPWKSVRTNYFVCEDAETNRRIVDLPQPEQKAAILKAGFLPLASFNQTDFVKDRVAVEVQFGKYSFVAYDLFVKHLAFYVAGTIDVGVEVLPMKCLQAEMSSGPSFFEKELHNLMREGRGVPAVPLVMIGIAP